MRDVTQFFTTWQPTVNSPSQMNNELRLWCIVLGESVDEPLFRLTLRDDDTVSELKQSIRREIPGYDTLNKPLLYKPRKLTPIALEDTLQERVEKDIENFAAPLTKSAAGLRDLFPKSEAVSVDRLHIIVKFPVDDGNGQPPYKRARLAGPDPKQELKGFYYSPKDDEWIFHLHQKLWNRQDLRSQVFRTVRLTYPDYGLLEKQLSELFPERQEGRYEAAFEGALSVKRDFLASINTGRNVVAKENEDDNDDELRSLFSATLNYLDLHSLGLKKPPPQMPSLLFIRQEYEDLSRILDNLPINGGNSAMIAGQPGIGKTLYLYFRLIQSIVSGIGCLFRTIGGSVYHVAESITVVDEWSGGPIIAFCDLDGKSEPPRFLTESKKIQIIAASSPGGAGEKWLDTVGDSPYIRKLISTLWSQQELILTGLFLNSHDLLYPRLQETTTYFGYNPRICFRASRSPQIFTENLAVVRTKIVTFAREHLDKQSLLIETFTNNMISHSVFDISPKNNWRLFAQAKVGAISPWALDTLFNEHKEQQEEASYNFYKLISTDPHAGTLRGQMFERQALKYLSGLEEKTQFTIRSLTDSKTEIWTYPGPTGRSLFTSSTVAQLLQGAVAQSKPIHLVPTDPHFPAVDSIVYDPGQRLAGIQVTVRPTHTVAVAGLEKIQSWLKLNTPLAALRPSIPGNHWRLIFVVPHDMALTYEKQAYEKDTTLNYWSKKIDQFVLGLKEDTIWARTMRN